MRHIVWLHIWEGIGERIFLEIHKNDLPQLRAHYGDFSSINYFAGTSATVVTIADSRYLSRGDCLAVASKFVKGEYVYHTVDLDRLTVTRKNGVPLSQNPR